MSKPRQNKIIADIEDRKLEIGGILAVDEKTNKLIFIVYDSKGLVSDISRPENSITLYGKDNPENRAMHEIITLAANKKE